MSRRITFYGLGILLLWTGFVVSSPGSSNDPNQQPPGSFKGVPRDIDYIKNAGWTQIILQGSRPGDELVATSTNDLIVRILLVALMQKHETMVAYADNNPKKLTAVSLMSTNRPYPGQVQLIAFSERDNTYRAKVIDQNQEVDVWTKSAQMQGVLETAMRESIPVMEFSYDPVSKEIARGKVNVSIQQVK